MELDPNLRCSICFGLFVKTVALPCQDKFCLVCIDTWTKTKRNNGRFSRYIDPQCPLCRTPFKVPHQWTFDLHIDSIVDSYVSKLNQDKLVALEAPLQDRGQRLALVGTYVPHQLELEPVPPEGNPLGIGVVRRLHEFLTANSVPNTSSRFVQFGADVERIYQSPSSDQPTAAVSDQTQTPATTSALSDYDRNHDLPFLNALYTINTGEPLEAGGTAPTNTGEPVEAGGTAPTPPMQPSTFTSNSAVLMLSLPI